MTPDLMWLTLTALMTALFWVPYILNRVAVRGLMGAMANPSSDDAPHADWAERAIKAHRNAVENLVVFAPLVIIASVTGMSTPGIATAAMIFFFARLAHFLIFLFGIPVLRTLSFGIGWFATLYVALILLGVM